MRYESIEAQTDQHASPQHTPKDACTQSGNRLFTELFKFMQLQGNPSCK